MLDIMNSKILGHYTFISPQRSNSLVMLTRKQHNLHYLHNPILSGAPNNV